MSSLKFPARTVALILTLLLISLSAVGAGNLYRYQDKKGNPVISHTLPQGASQRGYEILTGNGRVLEKIAPALTEKELAEKRAREEEIARQAEAARQRQAEDRQLLRSYSHPDEVIGALRRRLEQMRSLIRLKQGNIASLKGQIRDEQSRAANIERSGNEIPERVLRKIEGLQSEVTDTEAEISRQEAAIAVVVAEYEQKVLRLEALTDISRTLALDPGRTPTPE